MDFNKNNVAVYVNEGLVLVPNCKIIKVVKLLQTPDCFEELTIQITEFRKNVIYDKIKDNTKKREANRL
jgi:hypothetical protein